MSLLLDALKKAAKEKNKNQSSDATDSQTHQDEDLDLELQLDEPPQADFPQVDEQVIEQGKHQAHERSAETARQQQNQSQTQTAKASLHSPGTTTPDDKVEEELGTSDQVAVEAPQETADEPASPQAAPSTVQEQITPGEKATPNKQAEAQQPASGQITDELSTQDTPSAAPPTDRANEQSREQANDQVPASTAASTQTQPGATQEEPQTTPAAPAKDLPESTPATATVPGHDINQKIQSERALSALINKSNQYGRRAQLKRKLTLAAIITLVLIGSGLYFYMQLQTSNQQLYIADPNQAIFNQPPVEAPSSHVQTANSTPPPAQAPRTLPSKPLESASPPVQRRAKPVKKTVPAPKKITIERHSIEDPIHLLLQQAYQAFQRQDYRRSESLYQQVSAREARNRDALLGLAAIGIKQQRYEYARQKYKALLKLNPSDSLATAGLSSIEQQLKPELNESQLKFLLKEQPDAAHLHFALGSLYSSQQKWAEAQSAFFSAWSSDSQNADYAYNLAVSLDQLDKPKQALDFYRLSIKLKTPAQANFSSEQTEQRIRLLEDSLP